MIEVQQIRVLHVQIQSILFQNPSIHNYFGCATCFVLALIFLFDGHLYCELEVYGASSSSEVNDRVFATHAQSILVS